MNSKASELKMANQKLEELIKNLECAESDYDKAVEHSCNYLGDDDRIERFRDEAALSSFHDVNRAKDQLKAHVQLIQKLTEEF